MQITRSSIDTVKGPAGWFTGDVYIDAMAASPSPSRLTANLVHFMPGARTHWHRHPLSQTVFVTEGLGLCRRRGGPVEVIRRAIVSCSRQTRSTGTAPHPTGSWSTSPSTKATTGTMSCTGSSRSPTTSTPPPAPATVERSHQRPSHHSAPDGRMLRDRAPSPVR